MVNKPKDPAWSRGQGEPDPWRAGDMPHNGGCQRGVAPCSTPPGAPSSCGH